MNFLNYKITVHLLASPAIRNNPPLKTVLSSVSVVIVSLACYFCTSCDHNFINTLCSDVSRSCSKPGHFMDPIFGGMHGECPRKFWILRGVFWCSYLGLDEECYLYKHCLDILILFSPCNLLFPTLFALSLSEQHSNLRVSCLVSLYRLVLSVLEASPISLFRSSEYLYLLFFTMTLHAFELAIDFELCSIYMATLLYK